MLFANRPRVEGLVDAGVHALELGVPVDVHFWHEPHVVLVQAGCVVPDVEPVQDKDTAREQITDARTLSTPPLAAEARERARVVVDDVPVLSMSSVENVLQQLV